MFLHVCVILFTGGGMRGCCGGVCVVAGGCAWLREACMVAGGWVCMVAGGMCMVVLGVVHGCQGHAWLQGACVVAGGLHGCRWGHAWLWGGLGGCGGGVGRA